MDWLSRVGEGNSQSGRRYSRTAVLVSQESGERR